MLKKISINDCDLTLVNLQKEFPKYLKTNEIIYNGDVPFRNRFHLGVIGSRRPSIESREILDAIFSRLHNLPLRIISGGALGVDAQAHASALKWKIPTYSWVVGDPQAATPHTNRPLFHKISSTPGSSIITPKCLYRERNLGLQSHFWLERNAWIAANSDLLLVIQAKERSGTWSTVKICQDFGIPTYAVTGSPVDPCYSGNNLMISMNYALPLPDIKTFTEDLKSHIKHSLRNAEKNVKDVNA